MQEIPINSSTKTVQGCFRDCLYEIPNFQRPYAWEDDQLTEYWNDIVLAQSDFFFGATVTWVSETRDLFRDTFSVIDGQQRITTSAIALSVIRDFFTREAKVVDSDDPSTAEQARRQASTTQGYLVASDDDGEHYPVITRDEPAYHDHVLQLSEIPTNIPPNQSGNRILAARVFFENYVSRDLDHLAKPADRVDRLKELRQNVLRVRLIQVELGKEEDAFLIFETLNDRGADLHVTDLVKNMLVRSSTNQHTRNTIANRYQRMTDAVTAYSDKSSTMDRFLWQSWNSRYPAVKESELYKALKVRVGDNADAAIDYLKELETDAALYKYFDRPGTINPSEHTKQRSALAIPEVRDSLTALDLFGVSVANSAILSLLRKYEDSRFLARKNLISALESLEHFHFQTNSLTTNQTTGGTRARCNRFATALYSAGNKADVAKVIKDLTDRLKSGLPSDDRSMTGFRRMFYAPSETLTNAEKNYASSRLIRYVLMKFAKHFGTLPSGTIPQGWTIEHIDPQKNATQGKNSPQFKIGNLTLLTSKINNIVDDAPLGTKVSGGLVSCSALQDDVLRGWQDVGTDAVMTDEIINARTEALGKLGLSSVWTV